MLCQTWKNPLLFDLGGNPKDEIWNLWRPEEIRERKRSKRKSKRINERKTLQASLKVLAKMPIDQLNKS